MLGLIPVPCRIRPIVRVRDIAVFDRIKMDGVDVAAEIFLAADRMFPASVGRMERAQTPTSADRGAVVMTDNAGNSGHPCAPSALRSAPPALLNKAP